MIVAADHVASPLGKYYLYYAPHDAPGGINLAYASSIGGPYTDYPGNPVLRRDHQGRFEVSHVSSPHVVWMSQYGKYFMYFHGENTTTRWAYSSDGVNWQVASDNVALRASQWGADYTETSYAKVFEYAIPGIGDRYTMLMMTLRQGGNRRIGLATSQDGKHFTARDPALVTAVAGEGTQLSGPFYWPHDGHHYVVYHGDAGKIFHVDVGAGFDREDHLGVFYDPAAHFPELGKSADAFLLFANGRWHMFYTVGLRLAQTIAYAVELLGSDVVIDNGDPGFSASPSWQTSTSSKGFHGTNYLHDGSAAANPGMWAKWKPTLPQSGFYRVLVRWPAEGNRPDAIRYKVYHQGVVTDVLRNQRVQNGSWVELGRFRFDAGTSEANRVNLDAGSDAGFAVADAAWFIFDE